MLELSMDIFHDKSYRFTFDPFLNAGLYHSVVSNDVVPEALSF